MTLEDALLVAEAEVELSAERFSQFEAKLERHRRKLAREGIHMLRDDSPWLASLDRHAENFNAAVDRAEAIRRAIKRRDERDRRDGPA